MWRIVLNLNEGAGRSGRWSRNSPKFWSDVQARNKKCKKFCSPVSFVFSMSRFFLWTPLSTAAGIIHCLSFTWDITMYGPRRHWVRARGPVAFLWGSSEAKPQQLTSFGSKTMWLSTFMHLHKALLSLCGFKYPHILCFPLLSRIITFHASKCERGGSMGFYYDSLNTCTRTAVLMPLSRLLFWIETMADVKLGLDQMRHNAISHTYTGS